MTDFPGASDIQALEETLEKYVVFLDFHYETNRAIALAGEINRSCPSVVVVAFNVNPGNADLIAIVRTGIVDVLSESFTDADVATAVLNVTRKLAGPDVRNGIIYGFLPAKPGSGASSLAAYSALMCARYPDCRPLLLDFDIRLGITSFVLKLDSANSIIDAFENVHRMEKTLWQQLVSERDDLDVLGSAPADFGVRVPAESFQAVLKWARRQYSTIVVDLPGTMEDFEIATMQQAGTVFLVCGPDLAALHVARLKIDRLRALNLLDRISLVLNRVDKRTGLTLSAIESILTLPVQFTVGADERGFFEAVRNGTGLSSKSPISKQIEAIARKMASSSVPGAGQPRKKRRFVEFFSIAQAKGLDPWHL
jgi:pilus assembly protein CpaE